MDDAGVFDEATIIVHGDHGSRISVIEPAAQYADQVTDRDLIDSYATLFAMRGPTVTAGYDRSFR